MIQEDEKPVQSPALLKKEEQTFIIGIILGLILMWAAGFAWAAMTGVGCPA
jgi:hypothetical protein